MTERPPALAWHVAMTGRDPGEEHRVSTPLELFFDLCFVVAVSAAAANLHHDLAKHHLAGLAGYAIVFFALWWAWVNYSWFASAYDTGDVSFRLTTFVIMAGVLVLAAGVPSAAGDEHDFGIVVAGYAVMRIALIPLWLRVAREHPDVRRTALRYAAGVGGLQVLWILRTVLLPHTVAGWVLFGLLVVGELATPYWAERATAGTPWHRHHIAERFELFTIIVLGEVILATTGAISTSLEGHGLDVQLALLIVGALVLVFSMWWMYFKLPAIDALGSSTAFAFGYVHYVVFASVAGVGACLAMLVEVVEGAAEVGPRLAVGLLAGFYALYLLSLVVLHSLRGRTYGVWSAVVVVAALAVVVALGLPAGAGTLLVGAVGVAGLSNVLWGAARVSG